MKKPILAISAAALATTALTAGNTINAQKSGDGRGAVTGYVASSVHYTLDATHPFNVDSAGFTLDSAPNAGSTIKIRLVSSTNVWYSCTNSGMVVTCATTSPQATVLTQDELRLVVSD